MVHSMTSRWLRINNSSHIVKFLTSSDQRHHALLKEEHLCTVSKRHEFSSFWHSTLTGHLLCKKNTADFEFFELTFFRFRWVQNRNSGFLLGDNSFFRNMSLQTFDPTVVNLLDFSSFVFCFSPAVSKGHAWPHHFSGLKVSEMGSNSSSDIICASSYVTWRQCPSTVQ